MLDYLITSLLLAIPVAPMLIGFWAGWTLKSDEQIAKNSLYAIQTSIIALLTLATLNLAPPDTTISALFRLAPLTWLMLALVLLIGWVVTRFSQQYMLGEPRIGYFYRWLLMTLSAVLLTILANNLLLLFVGWVLISLSLHRLLTFYPHRPRTQLAAHKKFIIARVGEISLAGAFLALHSLTGSSNITEILQTLSLESTTDSPLFVLATCLIGLTAFLKCAQLPLHGWLIQVVDAPTPVSALLHAGVINLGGYLLILFAPIMQHAPVANIMLLISAGFSLLLSALIMQTRVSVKVRLAWSTSSQMGFMLVECALGFYELALLHLIAHSCYKAHAFLFSGNAVRQHQANLLVAHNKHSNYALIASGFIVAAVVGAAAYFVQGSLALWTLLGIAMTYYLATTKPSIKAYTVVFFNIVLMVTLITIWKSFAPIWFNLPKVAPPSLALELFLFFLIFMLTFAAYRLNNQRAPQSNSQLQYALFAGLYLDEWLTRLTQRIWPTNLVKTSQHASPTRGH